MKILIVEDERIIAEDINEASDSYGHKITGIVSSAAEAFISIRNELPDTIFIDIGLKGPMDGLEIARVIYEEYGIRAVFLTSFFQKIPANAHLIEPYAFLIKPVVHEEIVQALEKIMISKYGYYQNSKRWHKQETFYSKLLSI